MLKNKGSKTATDIVIDFPGKGLAVIVNPDDSRKTINFNRVIKLDNLRANNVIVLAIWSESEFFTYNYDDINVTHKNGVGEVTWPIEATGIAWYVQSYSFFMFLFLYFIFMIGMALGAAVYNKDKKENATNANNETPKE